MRIIAGTLGGRRLDGLTGTSTRPTSDRVREALFSRIEARFGIGGRAVLDLFAGTGALGLEALSRGAESLVCVETGPNALRVLGDNVRKLDVEAETKVMQEDVETALERLSKQGARFGGVFVDPPYGKGLAEATLGALDRLDLVEGGGWVSVEVGKADSLSGTVGALTMLREDCYGNTKLVLYSRASPESSEAHGEGGPKS